MAKKFIICAILVSLAVVAESQFFNFGGGNGGAPAQMFPQRQGGRAPEVIDSVTGLVTGIIGTTFKGVAGIGPNRRQPSNGQWGQSSGNGGGWGQSSANGGGWGQSSANGGSWGQSSGNGGGWGQSSGGGGWNSQYRYPY